ncbi:MAG: alpha/beta hydrolase [Ruminococcaceae bacterium]|nr:alpha/beta hydrolase [Oscillospiraceae bacterium]
MNPLTLKATAKLLAKTLFTPFGPSRPSKKVVMKELKEVMKFDEASYETWEKVPFSVQNEGNEILGDYYPVPNAKGICILAHGFGKNRYAMLPQAQVFRELGYTTVTFDQRRFGESKAKNGTFSLKEATDLLALVRWAREKWGADTRVIVLGVSMGAMTVMNAIGHENCGINAAVEDCGPTSLMTVAPLLHEGLFKAKNPYLLDIIRKTAKHYGINADEIRPIEGVRKSTVPLLVVHGAADSAVPVSDAEQILEASNHPLSRKVIFEGREHAYSVVDYEKYKMTVAEFLGDVFLED